MNASMANREKQDLRSFFDHPPNCRVLQEDANKRLLRTCDPGNELFIKIFKYPKLFASRFQYGGFTGGAKEFKTCVKLSQKGIRTPKPIGCAVKRNMFGFPVQSLYAARWVTDSHPLPVYIDRGQAGRLSTQFSLDRLVENLGAFAGNIHRQGVYSTDFNVRNFLVTKGRDLQKESDTFFLVDYERLFFKHKVNLRRALVGLSHIGAYLISVDQALIPTFCRGYVGKCPVETSHDAFLDLVMQAALKKKGQWDQAIEKRFDRIARHMSGQSLSKDEQH